LEYYRGEIDASSRNPGGSPMYPRSDCGGGRRGLSQNRVVHGRLSLADSGDLQLVWAFVCRKETGEENERQEISYQPVLTFGPPWRRGDSERKIGFRIWPNASRLSLAGFT